MIKNFREINKFIVIVMEYKYSDYASPYKFATGGDDYTILNLFL